MLFCVPRAHAQLFSFFYSSLLFELISQELIDVEINSIPVYQRRRSESYDIRTFRLITLYTFNVMCVIFNIKKYDYLMRLLMLFNFLHKFRKNFNFFFA